MDVTLPDGNGLDLLEEMRGGNAHAPALVVTAHCTQAFVNRAFSLGASYLCKPFLPDNLVTFAKRSPRTKNSNVLSSARLSYVYDRLITPSPESFDGQLAAAPARPAGDQTFFIVGAG